MKVITYRLEDIKNIVDSLDDISKLGVSKLGRSMMSIVTASDVLMNGVVQDIEEVEETDTNTDEKEQVNENVCE